MDFHEEQNAFEKQNAKADISPLFLFPLMIFISASKITIRVFLIRRNNIKKEYNINENTGK